MREAFHIEYWVKFLSRTPIHLHTLHSISYEHPRPPSNEQAEKCPHLRQRFVSDNCARLKETYKQFKYEIRQGTRPAEYPRPKLWLIPFPRGIQLQRLKRDTQIG